jgi:GTP-binding protein
VFTKGYNVNESDRDPILKQIRTALSKHPAAYPEIIATSSEKGWGIETLRSTIATLV